MASCLHIKAHKNFRKISLHQSGAMKWHFKSLPQLNQIVTIRYHCGYDILKYNFYETLYNLIETSMKFVHKDPMNNMPAFVQLALMSIKCIFFKSMITNKIYTEMSLQGNLSFYECPHTCLIDITWVCIYKYNLFILINILRRRKFIHTPDNTHRAWMHLFYIFAFHAYLYLSVLAK